MNRRSFFKSIAKGVLATAATLYAPRLLDEELVDVFTLKNKGGEQVGALALRQREAEAFLTAMSEKMAELFFYGNTSFEPSEFKGLAERFEVRWTQPVMEVSYGEPQGVFS